MSAATMKVSSLSFRSTGTLLILMVPIFIIGRVLGLSQEPANVALGTLATGAGGAIIVGSIAAIWGK